MDSTRRVWCNFPNSWRITPNKGQKQPLKPVSVSGITFVIENGKRGGEKQQLQIEGQDKMVRAEDIPGSSAKLLEARTFLVVRSLKRAYLRVGDGASLTRFREALSQELTYNRIRFTIQENRTGRESSQKGQDDLVVCFERLIIQFATAKARRQDDINLMKRNLRKTGAITGLVVRLEGPGLDIEKINL